MSSKLNKGLPSTLLQGQTALVTGGDSGIGKGCALALGQAGANVVINYYAGADKAEALCAEIRKFGVKSAAFQADVSKEADVIALFANTCKTMGTVDILVSNAGIQKDAPLDQMTLADWNAVLATNLTGQFLCAREAVKEFKRRGVVSEVSKAAGKIICMSSVHEIIPWGGHVNYASSKGGVHMMMQTLAQELAPHKIRVNGIAPGAIQTHINKNAWDTPGALKRLLTLIPYGRIGEPDDIGNCVTWLASDLADYITGATIFIDGGMSLYPGFSDNG